MASGTLISSQRVKISGLVGRLELNGVCGTVVHFDEAKGRYAIRLDEQSESVLIKRENLLLEQNASGSRAERRATLTAHVARQHELKVEGATHMAAVMAASSRSELSDDVWDRVVEIQRETQVACNACNSEYPALQLEAIEADAAVCWSHTAVDHAYYLLGQVSAPEVASSAAIEPAVEAKRLANRVLKLHRCAGRCRDAMLANAVLAAEGPFSMADAGALLATAPETCPALDRGEWLLLKERDKMHRELQEHWDRDTEELLAKRSAAKAGELV